jgi:PmbA protein
MSSLQEIVDRVVGQAKPGEQVEAFASRGGETSIRVGSK